MWTGRSGSVQVRCCSIQRRKGPPPIRVRFPPCPVRRSSWLLAGNSPPARCRRTRRRSYRPPRPGRSWHRSSSGGFHRTRCPRERAGPPARAPRIPTPPPSAAGHRQTRSSSSRRAMCSRSPGSCRTSCCRSMNRASPNSSFWVDCRCLPPRTPGTGRWSPRFGQARNRPIPRCAPAALCRDIGARRGCRKFRTVRARRPPRCRRCPSGIRPQAPRPSPSHPRRASAALVRG